MNAITKPMNAITKPMLATKCECPAALRFPVLATPKLDGIRCLKLGGRALTRSFKPISNRFAREWIEANLPDGLDGELMLRGGTFNETTSAIGARDGRPDFVFHVFDYVTDSIATPYRERMKALAALPESDRIVKVLPVEIRNAAELATYEEECIAAGYEGVMVNRTRISLAVPLDLTHDAAALLDFDLGNLLVAPRPLSFVKLGSATHSRDGDPIAAALIANLQGAFHVTRILSATPEISRPTAVKPLYLPEKFTPYRFTMSATFPVPELPRDNPLIDERVALGKALFSETALSRDATLSCASCHQAEARLPIHAGSASACAARLAPAIPCRCSTWHGRRVTSGMVVPQRCGAQQRSAATEPIPEPIS